MIIPIILCLALSVPPTPILPPMEGDIVAIYYQPAFKVEYEWLLFTAVKKGNDMWYAHKDCVLINHAAFKKHKWKIIKRAR